jgi:hypothetical protein
VSPNEEDNSKQEVESSTEGDSSKAMEMEECSSETRTEDVSEVPAEPSHRKTRGRGKRGAKKAVLKEEYVDIIRDAFWDSKPWILA